MDNSRMDEFLSDEMLDKAIKKGKRKTITKMVLISFIIAVIIFISGSYINTRITIKESNEAYLYNESYIKLTVPNGFISKSFDTFGLLGGRSNYTVSRYVGKKFINLENKIVSFGILPQSIYTRVTGNAWQDAGEWPQNYWENGYSKMIFFHPDISYKEYKNDLNSLDKIPNDKLIQAAVSFSKPYKYYDVQSILPNVNKSWYWIDAYRKEDFNRYKEQAKEYDGKATFIPEFDAVGVNIRDNSRANLEFQSNYKEVLQLLKDSKVTRFNDVYKELQDKGYNDPNSVPVLGAIVYGTKDEIKSLIGNPKVKAVSFGVVTEDY